MTPDDYIDALEEPRRGEIRELHDLIRATVPDLEPHVASGMLGYGPFHYRYASGREGDASLLALSSRKRYISLYVLCTTDGRLPRRAVRRAAAEGGHRQELRALQAHRRTSTPACCAS